MSFSFLSAGAIKPGTVSLGRTLMMTLRCCFSIILTSAIVSSLRILEAGDDVAARILPVRRSDLVMEVGNTPSLRSIQNHIFNQGILRTLKRSSPLDEIGIGIRRPTRSEQEEILRSTVHNGGIMRSLRSSQPPRSVHTDGFLRSLRSLPVDEDMEVMEDMEDEPVYIVEEDALDRVSRSTLPAEIRSIRSSLIPEHPYDTITLRYL